MDWISNLFWGGYFSISSHLAFLFKNSSNKKSTPSQSILCFGGSQFHIASPSLIVLPFLGDPRVGCSQRRYSILWIPMALHASALQVFKQSEISWQLPKFEDVGNAPCGGYIRVVRLSDSPPKKNRQEKLQQKHQNLSWVKGFKGHALISCFLGRSPVSASFQAGWTLMWNHDFFLHFLGRIFGYSPCMSRCFSQLSTIVGILFWGRSPKGYFLTLVLKISSISGSPCFCCCFISSFGPCSSFEPRNKVATTHFLKTSGFARVKWKTPNRTGKTLKRLGQNLVSLPKKHVLKKSRVPSIVLHIFS